MAAAADVLRRFWPYTRGDRRWLALGGLCALVVAGCELGTVSVFDLVTDRVLTTRHLAGFWSLAGWWLAIAALAGAAMFFSEYLTSLASERFALRLRDDVLAHAQRLPPDFFDRRPLGDLMVRLTEDVAVLEGITASGPAGAVTSALSAAAFAGAAAVVCWPLALVACAAAPVFFLAPRAFSGRMQRAGERERVLTGKLTSAIEENLSSQALIQAYSRQTTELRTLHATGDSWLRARMRQVQLGAVYGPAVYLAETLCALTVFGVGAWELARGAVTLGGLLAFAILLVYLYSPVQDLAGFPLSVSEAAESVSRVTEILDAASAVTDGAVVRAAIRSRGAVAFDDVGFAYPEAGGPVLRHLSFRAVPGQLVAITGPSGSGKSTIGKLLIRFYDPDAGRVLLDGIDIRDLSLRALRHNVTLLQQEHLLRPGTVADNIGYGKRGASRGEIVAAARAAGAHEFITALPGGYDTPAGQHGRLLSGGQAQRIAIARAILRDAPVFVLDEPTTGLSPADTRQLTELLKPVIADRTVIVITHDPEIAARADHVITLGTNHQATPASTPRLEAVSPGIRAQVGSARLGAGPSAYALGKREAQHYGRRDGDGEKR
jgi:ATP-binding cassette subfamily B protein